MPTNKNIPVFEKRIFWDVNFEMLNYDKKHHLLLSGYLSVATYRIYVIVEGIMEMT
jgi:hypothetical protein